MSQRINNISLRNRKIQVQDGDLHICPGQFGGLIYGRVRHMPDAIVIDHHTLDMSKTISREINLSDGITISGPILNPGKLQAGEVQKGDDYIFPAPFGGLKYAKIADIVDGGFNIEYYPNDNSDKIVRGEVQYRSMPEAVVLGNRFSGLKAFFTKNGLSHLDALRFADSVGAMMPQRAKRKTLTPVSGYATRLFYFNEFRRKQVTS